MNTSCVVEHSRDPHTHQEFKANLDYNKTLFSNKTCQDKPLFDHYSKVTSLQHEFPLLGFSGLTQCVQSPLVMERGYGLTRELPGQGLTSNSPTPELAPGTPEQMSPGSLEAKAQNTVS